jgi:hypothetical protein
VSAAYCSNVGREMSAAHACNHRGANIEHACDVETARYRLFIYD